jgi:8-oxo-dGTP diphosphatase
MPSDDHKLVEARSYKFCPWCGTPLVTGQTDGRQRWRCPKCDFIWYHNPIPAAGAIIENEGKILLVKRKFPPRVGDWCFPAGFMEYEESPVECCIRELKEETGLDIRVTRLFWNYAGHDDPRSHAMLVLYLAEISGGILMPGDDAMEVKYFDIFETPDNIAFQAHREAIRDYRRYKESGLFPGEE